MTVLVGEAPPRRGPLAPFEGLSGRRLRGLAGSDLDDVLMCNLFMVPMPRSGKGSAFWAAEARARAAAWDLDGIDLLLMAGRRVARAFGVPASVRYLEPFTVRGTAAYVVPHPSGVNRWFNAETNRARFRRFFQALDRVAVDQDPLPPGEFLDRLRHAAGAAGRSY